MLCRILLLSLIYTTFIDCKDFSNLDVINLKLLNKIEISDYQGPLNRETFSFFPHLTELVIKNSNLTLDTNFLTAIPRLRKLTLEDNNITKQESDIYGCCLYIKELYMINNHVKDLRMDIIGKIPHFVLVLNGEEVPRLNNNTFVGSRRVMQLNITYSSLEWIEEGVFQGLIELTMLNLEGNRLRSLAHGLLKPLKALNTLILKNNHLETFSGDSVFNLAWLRYIDISHNPIKKLAIEGIKDKAIRLKQIWVAGINGTTQDVIIF